MASSQHTLDLRKILGYLSVHCTILGNMRTICINGHKDCYPIFVPLKFGSSNIAPVRHPWAQTVEQSRLVHVVNIAEWIQGTYIKNLIHTFFLAVKNCRTTTPMISRRAMNPSYYHRVFDLSVTCLESCNISGNDSSQCTLSHELSCDWQTQTSCARNKSLELASTSGCLAYNSFLIVRGLPFLCETGEGLSSVIFSGKYGAR